MAASIFIPICISRLDGQNNELERFEHVIEALASGIYLGLLMLFMIPETIDDFVDVWSSKIKERLTIYTMALSSLSLGLFLVAIVEYIAAKASCCVEGTDTTDITENNNADDVPIIGAENDEEDHEENENGCQECIRTTQLQEINDRTKNKNEVNLCITQYDSHTRKLRFVTSKKF